MTGAKVNRKTTVTAKPAQSAVAEQDRRRFLDLCARYAIGAAPAVQILMMSAEAKATHNPPGCENGQGSDNHCTTSLGQGG